MPVAPGIRAEDPDSARGRDPEAWLRCQQRGLSRELTSPQRVQSDDEIIRRRQSSGLAQIIQPVWEALSQASSMDQLMIFTDPSGDVLWRYGSRQVRHEAEQIGFIEGADWSEASVGTNAISQALRINSAVHMSGEEHFAYSHMPWTCMAAPIRHPVSGKTLGILNVSGPQQRLGHEVVPMVRMSARLVSAMLQHSLTDQPRPLAPPSTPQEGPLVAPGSAENRRDFNYQSAPGTLHLRLLGETPAFALGTGPWQPVPLRMAEILALLSSRERGWTASELTSELYGDLGRSGTVRTDIHRLRQRVGGVLKSQPYRFADGVNVASDVALVEALVRQGDVPGVLDRYRQPLLARSLNERIQQWRVWLDREIRDLVMRSGTANQYSRWRRTELAWESELLTAEDPAPAG